ncbi:hypothetical protein ACX80L_05305 [Arthrobacter sp. MDT1-48-3]
MVEQALALYFDPEGKGPSVRTSGRSTYAAVGVIGTLLTAACNAPLLEHESLDVLGTASTAADSPPSESGITYLDAGSSRLLTETAGLRFVAGIETTEFGSSTCLVVVAPGYEQTTGGCGFNAGEKESGSYIAFGIEARLIPDGAKAETYIADGWDQPHPNLVIRAD